MPINTQLQRKQNRKLEVEVENHVLKKAKDTPDQDRFVLHYGWAGELFLDPNRIWFQKK